MSMNTATFALRFGKWHVHVGGEPGSQVAARNLRYQVTPEEWTVHQSNRWRRPIELRLLQTVTRTYAKCSCEELTATYGCNIAHPRCYGEKNSFYQSIFRCKNWSMHNKLRRSAVGLSDGQRRNTLCRPMCSCYSFHWGWTWPIDNPNLNPADYRWFEVLFSSGCIYPDGRRSNSMKNCSGLLSH